jgi:hypothetical protein
MGRYDVDSKLCHRIIKSLALATDNGLDCEVKAAVRTAGNFGAITASGAFKQVRAAHAHIVDADQRFRNPADFST